MYIALLPSRLFPWVLCGLSFLLAGSGEIWGLYAQQWLTSPRQLTVNEGLPTLDTYDVEQDQDGFIWIATDYGLAKYDGYDFQVLTTRDGLSNNGVIRIHKDRKNRLWLNSLGNLVILEGGRLEALESVGIQKYRAVFEMRDTPAGGMWVNYGMYVYYLDASRRLRKVPATIAEPTATTTALLASGQADTVLISNGEHLFFTYNEHVVDSLVLPASLRNGRVSALAQRGDLFYFVNEKGLQYWDRHSGRTVMQDPSVHECSRLRFEGAQLFAMHLDYGLKVYDLAQNTLVPAQAFRPADYCIEYLIDNEGNLWITTLGSGVFIYPPQTLPTYSAILPESHRRINKLMVHEDELYLGTFNGRIYTFDPEQNRVNLLVESSAPDNDIFDRIMAMVKLSTGELLVGKDKGFYVLRNNRLKQLSNVSVKALYLDREENLIVSSQRITVKADLKTVKRWIESEQEEGSNFAGAELLTEDRSYAAFTGSDGTVWLDNTEQGFTSYRDGKVIHWREKSRIFRAHINAIQELPDSTLVIATQGEGLVFMKNERFWVVDDQYQLPSNIINALHLAGDSLWVATNRGVALITSVDIDRQRIKINVYNRNDGLMTEDIADLVIWKDELMLATEIGLMGLPLNRQLRENIYPDVLIQSMEAGGEYFKDKEKLLLKHDFNDPTFDFLGISYRSQGKIRYSYRLEGYDKGWNSTSNRSVRYHNLSPGDYTFMVRAIDYKGQVSRQVADLSFRIQPHFTQTRAFLIFCVLLSLLLVGGAVYVYAGLRQKNRLASLVREKTADLDAQIAELARSNEELEQFARAASHDLKSPLRNVAGFVQLLARRADDRLVATEKEYIRMAVQGVKRMEQIINDLLQITKVDQYDQDKEEVDFAQIIDQIRHANQALLDEQQAVIILDTELPQLHFSRINAYQLLQNLIVNAVTYRSAAPPRINIGYAKRADVHEFYVRDNGQGIALEFQKQIFDLFQRLHHDSEIPGTGIGLAICKKIVERNGGTIRVVSAPQAGSTFYFTIADAAV